MGAAARIEHEAREHRVVGHAGELDPGAAQDLPVVLDVVARLGHRRIGRADATSGAQRGIGERRAGSSPAPGPRARRPAGGGRTGGTRLRSGSRRATGRPARRRAARARRSRCRAPPAARRGARRTSAGSSAGRRPRRLRPPADRRGRASRPAVDRGGPGRPLPHSRPARAGSSAAAPRAAGCAVRTARPAASPARRTRARSAAGSAASRSGSLSTRSATSSSTGTSRWMVTSSRESRALSACASSASRAPLGGHLGALGEHGLEIAVLGEQLLGALLADALHARHVVRGVAHQREEVDHLTRRHAQPLRGVGLVHPGLLHRRGTAAARVEQHDVRSR